MNKYSTRLTDRANIAGFPVETIIMADLMAIGYSKADAYNIAYSGNSLFSEEQNSAIREDIISTERFKAYLKSLKSSKSSSSINEDVELIDQQQAAIEILRVAKNLDDHDKDKAMLYAKYIDIARKSNDVTKDEESATRVYLPLECCRCPLYEEYQMKQKDK